MIQNEAREHQALQQQKTLARALDPVFIVLRDLSSLREYCDNVNCEIPCFTV